MLVTKVVAPSCSSCFVGRPLATMLIERIALKVLARRGAEMGNTGCFRPSPRPQSLAPEVYYRLAAFMWI